MKIYILNLALCIAFSYLAVLYSTGRKNVIGSRKANLFFALIPMISMSIVSSIRYFVGTDYGNYKDLYLIAKDSKELFFGDDIAFNASLKIIDNFFHDDKAMFAIYGTLIVVLFVLAIRNISSDFRLSLYLYITAMFFYSSFNGIRQWFVSAIVFCCYPLLVKKKYPQLIIILILCYFFHSSTVYYAMALLIVGSKPWGRVMNLVIIGACIVYMFFGNMVGQMILFISESKQEEYANMLSSTDSGANILRLAVAATPVIISFVFYRYLKNTRKDINILINFSVLNMLTMLLASRHWIFARFSIYFDVYNLILVPEFINMFNFKSRRIVRISIMILYLAYMLVLLRVDSELLPYKTIFGGYYP